MQWQIFVILTVSAEILAAQGNDLKARVARGVAIPSASQPSRVWRGATTHRLLQLDRPMNDRIRAMMVRRGAKIVGSLPDNTIVVAAGQEFSLEGLPISGTDELRSQDKMSPLVGTSADAAAYIVEFYPDVSRDDAGALLLAEGFTPIDRAGLNPRHFLITATIDDLSRLTQWDEVAYVFPAPPEMLDGEEFQNCAGALTAGLTVGQYAIVSRGWARDANGKVSLGYTFGDLTQKVDSATVKAEVIRAMNEWSKVARVQFTPTQSAAAERTVSIKFAVGDHSDGNPFDGPGGILAHTFYPANPEPIAGDIHMDADEGWHAGTNIDVYTVALHELGHALGLGHSDRPGSIMYPYYKYPAQLGVDDIAGIQALYGAPASSGSTQSTSTPSNAALSLNIVSPTATTAAPANTSAIAISGNVTNSIGTVSVTWQTDHGASGTASGSQNWSASAVPLAAGSTTITVTAADATHQNVTKSVTVTKAAAIATDNTAPTLTVLSPALTGVLTSNSTIAVTGAATDNVDVARVTWQSGVNSGTAVGTKNWSVAVIPLLVGTNTIVVRAYDAAGNTSWRSLSVTRR